MSNGSIKVLVCFGTRPEAIKLAPVILALRKEPAVHVVVCNSGQHREMTDEVLKVFGIKADYQLDIMSAAQDLFSISTRILERLKPVVEEEKPDLMLVHGDASTSAISALTGFYCKVPVAHVEAGLRTHHISNPWPEEFNRQMISRIARLHFAPTAEAKANLLKENLPQENIFVTGNTGIDAAVQSLDKLAKSSPMKAAAQAHLVECGLPITNFESYQRGERRCVLITAHRRENLGQGLENICAAVRLLAVSHQDVDFVFPVHPNPKVSATVKRLLSGGVPNIYVTEHLDYFSFILLVSCSYLILSDSGGIQEEACRLGVPTLVMRDETERGEGIGTGPLKLIGTNPDRIFREAGALLDNAGLHKSLAVRSDIFGDGHSSERIVQQLKSWAAKEFREPSKPVAHAQPAL